MSTLRLLCTDLDRTLIPNGPQTETPGVRTRLADLLSEHDVRLTYVSGRDIGRVDAAIHHYDLPLPDYVIADVGSSLYEHNARGWQLVPHWQQALGRDWKPDAYAQLRQMLQIMEELALQEEDRQGPYKLSYYVRLDQPVPAIMSRVSTAAKESGLDVNLIYSVDEEKQVGLLDILPRHAGKHAAIVFLLQELGLHRSQVLFAGDSGNDLDVMGSDIPSVLVANAMDEVKEMAMSQAQKAGHPELLYIARGHDKANGCYAAGILEGVYHFFPQLDRRPA